jgi:hypothetical protein
LSRDLIVAGHRLPRVFWNNHPALVTDERR